MKTKLIALILIISSYNKTFAQLTRDEDRNSYVVAGFHAGSDFKHVISGLQLGYRIGNVYVSANSFFPITSYALAPKMVVGNLGYNIGSFQGFLSYGYQTVGRESEQYFRHTKDEFINGFRAGGGVSFYPATIPMCFTAQRQGKQSLLNITLYKAL